MIVRPFPPRQIAASAYFLRCGITHADGLHGLTNPYEDIKGHSLDKRMLYLTDAMYSAVYVQGSASLRDAMDLACLTGQRPADALRMSEHDIMDGYLIVTQAKTKQPLRINARKAAHKIVTASLLTNTNGKRSTSAVLRNHFDDARRKLPPHTQKWQTRLRLLRSARQGCGRPAICVANRPPVIC